MDHQLYVADVVNNRLYRWNDLLTGTKSFDGYEGVFIQADQVILVYSSSTVSNPSMRILRIRKEIEREANGEDGQQRASQKDAIGQRRGDSHPIGPVDAEPRRYGCNAS